MIDLTETDVTTRPETAPEVATPPMTPRPLPRRRAVLTAALLIVAGDFLLFRNEWPGAGLLVFVALIAFGVALNARSLRWRGAMLSLGVGLLAALPLLEEPSELGLFLALVGLAVAAVVCAGLQPSRLTTLPLTLFRFALVAPLSLVADFFNAWAGGFGLRFGRSIFVWTVPVVFAAIFAGLFWSANPVIANLLDRVDFASLISLLDFWRMLFWLVLVIPVWALLQPRLKRWRDRPAATELRPVDDGLVFGRAAILRALIVFNALFAIETATDLTYLWGGLALPNGMSHAEYAHRGAYPLIVTALLAGLFVLLAMRRNSAAAGSRPIRMLVYAFIAQNVLLCFSAMFRLELYVEAYSLTEMRLNAGIWMGLVAVGLALILLRIRLSRSNEWLVAMNFAALGITLYGCALADYPAIIADFNVGHSAEMGGKGEELDGRYLYRLGPSALPALDRYVAAGGRALAGLDLDVRSALTSQIKGRNPDWRSWSFRDWRQAQYLAWHPVASSPETATH